MSAAAVAGAPGGPEAGTGVSPYEDAPFIVIWETTRACDLACRHCRAAAVPRRHPLELTTAEAFDLADQIAAMSSPPPLLVLSGGDPLKRPDLVPIIRHAAGERGLRVSITPSATPLVTPEAVQACVEAGLARWAFSLDGPDAASHDSFRGQAGSFDLTLRAARALRDLGMPLQINTTVCRVNRDALPRLGELVQHMGAVLWSVFFLVPVGRGRIEDSLDAAETEAVLQWLDAFARGSSCDVKTTEAPQWRRIRAQASGGRPERAARPQAGAQPLAAAAAPRQPADPRPGDGVGRARRPVADVDGVGRAPRPVADGDGVGRAPRPVADGDGFVFVDHLGRVYPSGFLPLVAGNLRQQSLGVIYRTSPLLRSLRDRERLKGKCRYCEFRDVCGGSRARAWAISGDPLESDPFCPHMPRPGEALLRGRGAGRGREPSPTAPGRPARTATQPGPGH